MTTLGFDAGSSRELSGEVRLVSVESAMAFLSRWRCETLGEGGGGSKVGCFSGEVSGDVRKLVSATAAIAGTGGFLSLPTDPACSVVVDGLGGEVWKDSITLVSATETSARGSGLGLILITLSSRGCLDSWSEETIKLPCRLKIGGISVIGGNTAELIGDVGTA